MITRVKGYLRALVVRTQSLTGTDNLYLVRGGFWTGFGQTLGSILSLAQILVFAHYLSPQDYGTYKYLLSIAGMLGFLTLTGMNTAVTQMTASGVQGALPFSVHLQLKWNTAYFIASIIGSLYYLVQGNTVLSFGLFILGISFPISSALNTYGAYLSGKRDFRTASLYNALGTLTYSILLITATILTKNILIIVIAYALGTLLPGLYFYRRIISASHHPSLSSQMKSQLATYGGHLSFMNVLATVDQYIDKVLLFQNTGSVQLAVYSLAQAAPERIKSYAKSIAALLLPKMSSRELSTIRPVFYTRILQGASLGFLVSISYWIVAPHLFSFIFPQYLESIAYSRVFMFTTVFTLPNSYIASIFRGKRMLKPLYISSTVGHSLKIILYLFLGSAWGIWGLVWAALITQVIGTVLNCVLWEYESRKLLS
ncbi:MAG: oligosaccharide flippase family protein [Candidatus Pacebacteria bacterium]|nr:oligosaccharide flippase family protein [Candidatus Paceibacterota bacterium]